MAQKTQMQTKEKNNYTIRGTNKRRICLQMFFYSFKSVIDHANVHFDKINKNKDSKTPKYCYYDTK